ncbi:MAG: TldD/PmbA family protein [Chloroflexota bacterium]
MERIIELAKKRGCEAAEVYFSALTRTPVEYEFGRLKQVQTVENSVIAVRVIKDGKLGFATSTKQGDYEALVDNAVATAQFGTTVEFRFAAPAALPTVNCYDRAVVDLSLEQMLAAGSEMVEAIKAYEPKINALAQAVKVVSEVRILTSGGLDANYRRTEHELFAGGELVEGDNFLMCYDFDGGAKLVTNSRQIAERAIERFRLARTNRPLTSGKYPVILTPVGLTQCLGPIEASISGSAVQKGFSPWKDALGQTVAAANITVYDDGVLDWAAATAPFDAEGTPRQKTPIIDRGVLRNFLVDRRTAQALGRVPTGNAARGSDTPPSVAPTTLVMEAGDADLAAMIKGIKEGVIIDQLMGAWAGNAFSGEVSGNIALGYKVENGEITGRVKDCMFSINLFDVLKHQVAAISKERQYKGALLPWVLVDGAGISTKS